MFCNISEHSFIVLLHVSFTRNVLTTFSNICDIRLMKFIQDARKKIVKEYFNIFIILFYLI